MTKAAQGKRPPPKFKFCLATDRETRSKYSGKSGNYLTKPQYSAKNNVTIHMIDTFMAPPFSNITMFTVPKQMLKIRGSEISENEFPETHFGSLSVVNFSQKNTSSEILENEFF